MHRFAFASGIGGSAENALFEVAKQDGETVFPLTGEEFGRLAARDELLFEGMQRGARFLHAGQDSAVFARRLLQQACVVLLQPEEGMGVAADDVHQTTPTVHSQFGGSGSFLDEPQRLFEFGGVLLQALLIQRVAFEQVIFQTCRSPAAELGGIFGFHAVTHGKCGIQVVVLDLPRYLTFAFGANYRVILGSCFFFQFCLGIDVFQMQTDVVGTGIKQLCHLRLR